MVTVAVFLTLRIWFWQALPWHQVHHRRLTRWEAQSVQGHVAVEETALVDQPEDLSRRNALLGPIWNKDFRHSLSKSCDFNDFLFRPRKTVQTAPGRN